MSALPKAVRKQIADANKAADVYYKSVALAKGEGTPPAGDPPADPPAAPSGDPLPDGSPPPTGTPPSAVNTPPTPLPTEAWETKYKVLQGKYNAEVPRLQGQVRELAETSRNMREQLTSTQSLLASLGSQQVRSNELPPTAPAAKKRLVTDDEIKQFGPDLYDFVKRTAAEEILPAVDSRVDSRMAPMASKVEAVGDAVVTTQKRVARNDQETVLAQLAAQVPTWQQLNEDPLFLEWLDQRDPYSGHRRGELLDQAYKAYDGSRVVAFFLGYLNEHAAVTPPANLPQAPAPKAQKNLDEFVAPGAPKTGAAVTPDGSGKRVWTRPEIGRFYEDARAGKYRSKPEDQKRIEADIFAAQREGRIR